MGAFPLLILAFAKNREGLFFASIKFAKFDSTRRMNGSISFCLDKAAESMIFSTENSFSMSGLFVGGPETKEIYKKLI